MQLNMWDWVDETMAKIAELVCNNCRWINAGIDKIARNPDHKLRLCTGHASDHEAEQVIFAAAQMRDDHCKRLHKKKNDLLWNSEQIEA